MTILETKNLSRSFGGLKAVNNVDFSLMEGEVVSIIGPNGAGKTTLFNLLTGTDHPDQGKVFFEGKDITRLGPEKRARLGLIRTFQHGRTFANLSVLDNLLVGAHTRRRASNLPTGLRELYEILQAFPFFLPGKKEEKKLETESMELLRPFGNRLTPRVDQPAFSFSYANRRRIEIARALAARPRVLLLDEPTAGMNPSETLEVLDFLQNLKKQGHTLVVIEHKLPLILPLSDRVIVMDEGQVIANGPPLDVPRNPRVIEAYLGRSTIGRSPKQEVHGV